MTIIPRTAWEDPAVPVSGPVAQLGVVSAIVWHYPGGNTGTLETDGQKAAYLRAEQRDYVSNRGYSLGYNWTIFPDGSCWEARGLLYQSAANGSTSWNEHGFACQFATPTVQSDLTAAQIKAAQELTAYVEAAVHRPVGQWCHRDVRSQVWPAIASPGKWTTSCPGDLIYARCHDGQFRPADPPPTPPEPITEDDVQIRYRDKRYYNIWLVGAAPALNLSGQLDAYFATKGIELVEGEHDQMLRGLLVQSGLTTADLVPR